MTERAEQLSTTADGQIGELIDLLRALDQAALDRPCPGREKLGDGTIAASVRHTADNYQRIAGFVQNSDRMSHKDALAATGAHRIPRFMRAFGHAPADHAERGPAAGQHEDQYAASDIDLDGVVGQLSASRDALRAMTELSDSQLDTIPPKDSFRFCDGQRTLEQVLAGLLKHQGHQVDALKAARP